MTVRWLLAPLVALVLLAGCGRSPGPLQSGADLPGIAADASRETPAAAEETLRAPDVVPDFAPPVPLQPARWADGPAATGAAPPALQARAALLLDEGSGAVLFASNAHERLAPASLTKIATAVVALEQGGDLDREVEVDVDSRLMRGSSVMGLQPGDRFTLRDLLYGLMLPSGNDAALAIGRAVSGSDNAFVREMNGLAARLGLADTHFANPHGLNARDHYASAHDLAILARYAMSLPSFRELAAAKSWVAHGSREIRLANVNILLNSYAGADGVKTGFTNRAGKTVVASAARDGHRLFAVLLNDPAREADAAALLDWGFTSHQWP